MRSGPIFTASRAQLNSQLLSTDNCLPDWRPFHTNLIVFSSQADFHLTDCQMTTNWVASIVFLITTLHGPSWKHLFQQWLYCFERFVSVGTCLPIRCLETGCMTPLFIRLLHSNSCQRYSMLNSWPILWFDMVYSTLTGIGPWKPQNSCLNSALLWFI
jgi:hypothetical protein